MKYCGQECQRRHWKAKYKCVASMRGDRERWMWLAAASLSSARGPDDEVGRLKAELVATQATVQALRADLELIVHKDEHAYPVYVFTYNSKAAADPYMLPLFSQLQASQASTLPTSSMESTSMPLRCRCGDGRRHPGCHGRKPR